METRGLKVRWGFQPRSWNKLNKVMSPEMFGAQKSEKNRR